MNKFLERINRLHSEIIVANKVRYINGTWEKLNTKTQEWEQLRIYKGGQVSLSHSRGTSTYLSHLNFMRENPGPYSLESLIDCMYRGEFHKYYGWVEGFWDQQTLLMYYEKLKSNDEPLHESYIKDHHTAFYKTTRRIFKGQQSYRRFLESVGENPDEISGNKLIEKFLKEGKYIEHEIVKILKSLDAPFEYFCRFPSGMIPDLYDKESQRIVDIKRSIKSEIHKEISKYTREFDEVEVIYLLGSREIEFEIDGLKKMSIYKWLPQQPCFKNASVHVQKKTLLRLDALVKGIDENQYEFDLNEYHYKLVQRIIELDRLGMDNVQIAGEVNVSYKYVNQILLGKALKEYSLDYSLEYMRKQNMKMERREKRKNEAIHLNQLGYSNIEISNQLGMSTDMIKYHLRNNGLNESAKVKKRNEEIHKLLLSNTNHTLLSEKFKWVVGQLKEKYPQISKSIVKAYYYSSDLEKDELTLKDRSSELVVELFEQGKNTQYIAETLNIPITSVREYLRKSKMGRKDIFQERNKHIHNGLKTYENVRPLKQKFELVANHLQDKYPKLTAHHIRTYYYKYYVTQS